MASEVYLYRGGGRVRRDAVRIEVHRSVTLIPDSLFRRCRQLESVLLHGGLLKIGVYAFFGCSSLRIFRCPATVTEIGAGAFHQCSRLAVVELPEGLQEIDTLTFNRCTSLEEVRIPAPVARIRDRAFFLCSNLVSVELGEGLRWIGDCTFAGCSSLENFHVPSSVVEIGREAFMNCRNLSLVQLHEDLGRIGSGAFRGCTSLSFRFVRLSERMQVVALDERTASVFEDRLSEITNAMVRGAGNPWEVIVGGANNPWEECKQSLGRAHEVLTYWELKGGTPTLELALWRAKIETERGERADVISNDHTTRDLSDAGRVGKRLKSEGSIEQDPRPSRRECRVKCGADVVIPEVLKFFSYRTTWS